MKNMKNTLRTFVKSVGLIVVLSCPAPEAKAVSLAYLLQPNASITSGNLVFFGFHNATQHGDLNIPFSEIFVDPIIGGPDAAGTDFGIRFSSSRWSLTAPNMEYDLGLDFRVRTFSGQPSITDNTLRFAGGLTGNAMAAVGEAVLDVSGRSLASKLVFMNENFQKYVDHKTFRDGPYTEIQISKDLAMMTGAQAGSTVTVTNFDQTFSQVPEGGPGLFATFSLFGILCWAGRGRFRKSTL